MYTTSGIEKLLERAELTIVQIAEATDTPIAKVADIALNYWNGLPATAAVVVTRHDRQSRREYGFEFPAAL